MKTAVVYKSVTGNTKMIANAIAAALGDECVYLGGAEGAPDCELYLVGSWTDKGGLLYTGDPSLMVSQVLGILVTLAIVVVLDLVIVTAVRAAFGGSLRVSAHDEALGLDVTAHGESAYPAFTGLDA